MTIDKWQSYLMQNCALFISMHVCRSKKFGLSTYYRYKNRAISSLGTPCSAIWFCYLRGPQNCFLNAWHIRDIWITILFLRTSMPKIFVKSKKSILRENIFNMNIFLWYFAYIKNSMKLIISRVYNQDYELINIFNIFSGCWNRRWCSHLNFQ